MSDRRKTEDTLNREITDMEKMLEELRGHTKYLKSFMEKYQIPQIQVVHQVIANPAVAKMTNKMKAPKL